MGKFGRPVVALVIVGLSACAGPGPLPPPATVPPVARPSGCSTAAKLRAGAERHADEGRIGRAKRALETAARLCPAEETDRDRATRTRRTDELGSPGNPGDLLAEAEAGRARGDWRAARTAFDRAVAQLPSATPLVVDVKRPSDDPSEQLEAFLPARWSSSGQSLALPFGGGVKVVSAPDWRPRAFRLDGERATADFSTDGRWLALQGDNRVALFRVADGKLVHDCKGGASRSDGNHAFSPGSKLFACRVDIERKEDVPATARIDLFDLVREAPGATLTVALRGPSAPLKPEETFDIAVEALAFARDDTLLSLWNDGLMRSWSTLSGKFLKRMDAGGFGGSAHIATGKNGAAAWPGTEPYSVVVLRPNGSSSRIKNPACTPTALGLSADGTLLAAGRLAHHFCVIDVASGSVRRVVGEPAPPDTFVHETLDDVRFAEGGDVVIAHTSHGGDSRLWATKTGVELSLPASPSDTAGFGEQQLLSSTRDVVFSSEREPPQVCVLRDGPITCSPVPTRSIGPRPAKDANRAAMRTDDGHLLFDAASGTTYALLTGLRHFAGEGFAPNGEVFAAVSEDEQQLVMFDAGSGAELRRIEIAPTTWRVADVSAPRAGELSLRVWGAKRLTISSSGSSATTEPEAAPRIGSAGTRARTDDGKLEADIIGAVIRILDVAGGATFDVPSGASAAVGTVRFSHDGRVVAALHADAHLRAFTVSGEPRWDWPLPPGLRHPAFALDASGAIAAVAGVDGIVLVTSGNAVRPLVSKPGPVTALAFTPDGKVLLALGPDGEVRLFATGDGAPLGTLVSGPGGAVFETPAGALEILGSATQLSKLVSCRFGDREVSAELCLDAFSARGLLAGALSGADDAVLPLL